MKELEDTLSLDIILVEDKFLGGYTIYFKQFPQIIAEGETIEEAKENLINAFNVVTKYATKNSVPPPLTDNHIEKLAKRAGFASDITKNIWIDGMKSFRNYVYHKNQFLEDQNTHFHINDIVKVTDGDLKDLICIVREVNVDENGFEYIFCDDIRTEGFRNLQFDKGCAEIIESSYFHVWVSEIYNKDYCVKCGVVKDGKEPKMCKFPTI